MQAERPYHERVIARPFSTVMKPILWKNARISRHSQIQNNSDSFNFIGLKGPIFKKFPDLHHGHFLRNIRFQGISTMDEKIESRLKAKAPFVVFSEEKGVLSEHATATEAVNSYQEFVKLHGGIAAEETGIYKRIPNGWEKF